MYRIDKTTIELSQCFDIAYLAAKKAAIAVMEIYHSDDWDIEIKSDNSPLTKADKESHQIIESYLLKTGIPILSEEGKDIPFEIRKNWDYFWLVDPLDGTKEFVKRNGEFTINIALIHNHIPIWGVVLVPFLNKCYYMDADKKVWLDDSGNVTRLVSKAKEFNPNDTGVRVVTSRSHLDEHTLRFIATLNQPKVLPLGSSLKFMVLAEGLADVYPRFAPTMEWDTAASQAILNVLGWDVLDAESDNSLEYNKQSLINPGFIVR